ncbi:MAG: DUF1156 domain-containing protein [Nostoc sp. ChiSLP02]|nr:DUF1156 domain-containing protein [Nostoc sp. DedSLP05]MDZ8099789.1 DUF1156 domain-containing protein [Nostoc sp. DedSLP01]MDZ8186883.1 DUF1156 domain-containing protein [Nostoc sp. ChiSLP02]
MYRKKLIEVALPLEVINKLSAEEKAVPRRGHPQTIHLWFARRPLAACRAVIFASLVDDPSSDLENFPTEEEQAKERQRLFNIIEQLVKWENSNNPSILEEARTEILKSTNGNPPPVLDPFCGGGSIPLEAQRLGLEAYASDLNPVPVLINKALIEIPPKFAGRPPVNPEARQKTDYSRTWCGVKGLAEDVRYYGQWIRDEAEKRIGHLYPKVKLPKEHGGGEAKVLAWFWAKTVKCPNPACNAVIPLARSFTVSVKKKEKTWAEPIIDHSQKHPIIRFQIQTGDKNPPDGTVNRRGTICICCSTPIPLDYLRTEGIASRIKKQMTAIVAEGHRGRVYLSPDEEQEKIANQAKPKWIPDRVLSTHSQYMAAPRYGMTKHSDLFTPRQLVLLTTISDLISEVRQQVLQDAITTGSFDEGISLSNGGTGVKAYAEAVTVYLSCAISRLADYNNTICSWNIKGGSVGHLFTRQAIPMSWDFIEVNPLEKMSGNWLGGIEWISDVLENLVATKSCSVIQQDAVVLETKVRPCISTDPPYYDNVPYADLSDFFYIWLQPSLNEIYPDLFRASLTPKIQELVADQFRFGSREKARQVFEDRLSKAFYRMREVANYDYPLTIFYAFKQSEIEEDDGKSSHNTVVASTGWETMLEGLLKANFVIQGTWPMRTERNARTRGIGSNALASSIVLVCRPRPETAPSSTRRQFVNYLKRELPDALQKLQQGNIAPVDLAQASIGPGMAIYSRYSKILEADGTPMSVRTALQLINQTLDEFFAEQEGEFDAETRFALIWFEQHAFNEGLFGEAETLSKAKNTAVQGMVDAGILIAKAGKVRLLRRNELPKNWNPQTDNRLPVWEATQHMIRELQDGAGNQGAANLLCQLGTIGEAARELAYRLYNICDRKGWAAEGVAYNSLVISWPEISRLAAQTQETTPVQMALL